MEEKEQTIAVVDSDEMVPGPQAEVQRFLDSCESDLGFADEIQSVGAARQMMTLLRFMGDEPAEALGHVMDALKADFEELLEALGPADCEAVLRAAQPCLLYPQLRYLPDLALRRLTKIPEDVLQFIAKEKIEEALPIRVRQQVFEACSDSFLESIRKDCESLLRDSSDRGALDQLCGKIKGSKKLFESFCNFCSEELSQSHNCAWAEIVLQVVCRSYALHEHSHSQLAFIPADVLSAARTLAHTNRVRDSRDFFSDCLSLCKIVRKLLQGELRAERERFEREQGDFDDWFAAQRGKKAGKKRTNTRIHEDENEEVDMEIEHRREEKRREKARIAEEREREREKKAQQREKEKEKEREKEKEKATPLLSPSEVAALNSRIKETVLFLKKQDPYVVFLEKVTDKIAPGYSSKIKRPMWMKFLEERANLKRYQSEEDFNEDVQLIFRNCETFNGKQSPYAVYGRTIENRWKRRRGITKNVTEAIDCPLPIVNDAWELMSTMDVGGIFASPPCEVVEGYDKLIEQPMDLGTIKKRMAREKDNFQLVHLEESVRLTLENCIIFNVVNEFFLQYASKLLQFWNKALAFYKAWAMGNKRDMIRSVCKGAESVAMALLDLEPVDSSEGDRAVQMKRVILLLVDFIKTLDQQHSDADKLDEFKAAIKALRKKANSQQFDDLESFADEVKHVLDGSFDYFLDKSTEVSLSVYLSFSLVLSVVAAKFPFLSRNKKRTSAVPLLKVIEPEKATEITEMEKKTEGNMVLKKDNSENEEKQRERLSDSLPTEADRAVDLAEAKESEDKDVNGKERAKEKEKKKNQDEDKVKEAKTTKEREKESEQSPVLKIRLKKESARETDSEPSADTAGPKLVFKLIKKRKLEESDEEVEDGEETAREKKISRQEEDQRQKEVEREREREIAEQDKRKKEEEEARKEQEQKKEEEEKELEKEREKERERKQREEEEEKKRMIEEQERKEREKELLEKQSQQQEREKIEAEEREKQEDEQLRKKEEEKNNQVNEQTDGKEEEKKSPASEQTSEKEEEKKSQENEPVKEKVEERVRPEPSPTLLSLEQFFSHYPEELVEYPSLPNVDSNGPLKLVLLMYRAPSFQRSLLSFLALFVAEQVKQLRDSSLIAEEVMLGLKNNANSDDTAIDVERAQLFTCSPKLRHMLQLAQLRCTPSLSVLPACDDLLARSLLPELCVSSSEDAQAVRERLVPLLMHDPECYHAPEMNAFLDELQKRLAKIINKLWSA